MSHLPNGLIAYGPNANCTLELCSVKSSVYQYRPSLAANSVFICFFAIAMILHIWRGIRWREYFFASAVSLGCISEIIGYIGRIMLYNNPFSFTGFMIQICCITFAPVFYCAAIYVLLSRVTNHLDPSISRVPPAFWYWFFIPCDIISLALQGSGGAMSSSSSGSNKVGVDISLAGLGFQVGTLALFCFGCIDYAVRYMRRSPRPAFPKAFLTFVGFLSISIILIFVRCAYRIDELKNGYSGKEIANQGLFIALEGCVITNAR
ncbi:hypothetical protein K461DRAFT_291832 [Myriangium duriaei CBS 260.36]|uniref:Parasitic phase-specific protein PSP-1 n=1 Tax=Myriangium duriaei CBS 260.36 TaxID=1168546 RepID=A0A9P4J874_9PEZI|nr:hypothetical protein K461DRAFT_291832 [Myriangium duriaei CBS 260.36]